MAPWQILMAPEASAAPWLRIRQCIPLRVTVVLLKPCNFCENGCPEILEIPEISVLGSVFRESDCYDKYRKYQNCSDILKFLELPELPEITRKLWKEMEIPEISFKISSYTWGPSYTTSLIWTDVAYITYIIYVLWLEFLGFWPEFPFLFEISVKFPRNFRRISVFRNSIYFR